MHQIFFIIAFDVNVAAMFGCEKWYRNYLQTYQFKIIHITKYNAIKPQKHSLSVCAFINYIWKLISIFESEKLMRWTIIYYQLKLKICFCCQCNGRLFDRFYCTNMIWKKYQKIEIESNYTTAGKGTNKVFMCKWQRKSDNAQQH